MFSNEMSKTIEQTCKTCEHENDSGDEYCGCCNSRTPAWREAGWHIEKRLQADIDRMAEQIEGLNTKIGDLKRLGTKYMELTTEVLNDLPSQDVNVELGYEYRQSKENFEQALKG